jgi:hypothetical protein
MAICVASDIRLITQISVSDISDADVNSLITRAQTQIIHDVSVLEVEERIESIDSYRTNYINGSNTTFYVKRSFSKNFLFDSTGDGSLGVDDITVYQYDINTDTRSELTVATINEAGYFTLSSAPASGMDLYVTYRHAIVSVTDPALKTATMMLAAAFCYLKLGADDFDKITLAELKVAKTGKSFEYFNDKYDSFIYKLQKLEVSR